MSDDDIVAAARACFLEHGPGVSTATIAQQLGVSQAALFKRFGTKEALMLSALMPPAIPVWVEQVDEGPDERPVDVQLLEIAAAMGEYFRELTPCMAALKASGADLEAHLRRYEVPPPIRGVQALTTWLTALQQSGRIGPCEPSAVALTLMGAMHGRAFLAHVMGVTGAPAPEIAVSDIVQTLWRGLSPVEAR